MPVSFAITEIITKKATGQDISRQEIEWVVKNFLSGNIADYQMAALLTAIFIKGIDFEETAFLTDAMLHSGAVLQFNDSRFIDKHSTGGVGDKTSFIVAPIAAACGVKVPMIAGRGLGHTGGTVDKIESVQNFKTSIDLESFKKQVKKHGIALIGQTDEIAPADKKIYALRHLTATVSSIPLITASIMSKKLAEGTSGIVMDIKWGSGAFMKTLEDARSLATFLSTMAIKFNKNIMTFITDMNQPLGKNIGNALELIECIEVLKGRGPDDLKELSLSLSGGMIYLAGLASNHQEGISKAKEALNKGKALIKFKELLVLQGANDALVDDYERLPKAKQTTPVLAPRNGYIHTINGYHLGLHTLELGSGKKKETDTIDFSTGFVLNKKIGDHVEKGETLLTIHHHKNQSALVDTLIPQISEDDYKIKSYPPNKIDPLIVSIKTHGLPQTSKP